MSYHIDGVIITKSKQPCISMYVQDQNKGIAVNELIKILYYFSLELVT